MSDNHLSKIITEYGELKGRVEELEKQIPKALVLPADQQVVWVESFTNRLDSLEKKLVEHGHHPLTNSDWSQFKRSYESWRNSHQEQINELKEEFNEHLHGEYLLLEVLREFKQLVFEELNDNPEYNDYLEKFLKIFDKLDYEYSNIEGYDEPTYKNPKDLGGENTVVKSSKHNPLVESRGLESSAGRKERRTDTDSKPSESEKEFEKTKKKEGDIANMVLKRCPYCTELFTVDANTLEIRGNLRDLGSEKEVNLEASSSLVESEAGSSPAIRNEQDLADSKLPEPNSKHIWSHLTDVSYCDICNQFAHNVGYDSECIINEPKEKTEPEKWRGRIK